VRWAARSLVAACALILSVGGLAVPAGAATCAYDPVTLSATVTVGNGESATIVRAGAAITLDGVPCGAATVTTTDTIVVNTTGIPVQIAIDLSGGPFEPGATAESDASSEIELTLDLPAGTPILRITGSTGSDHLVVGTGGINLNAGETNGDADVLITGNPAIVLFGGDDDDVLSVGGGMGTGAPGAGATVLGEAGADLLLGATGGSAFDGGAGIDELDFGAAESLVLADLGAGRVDHQGGGADSLAAIENLTGSPGDDRIVGDAVANVLRGGAGDDRLQGLGGDDTLVGGAGTDTVDLSSATSVFVDLGAGTTGGEGSDTLVEIEDVIGSPGDDVLKGDIGPNTLQGGAGGDTLEGAGGDDTLDGGGGSDTVSYRTSDQAVNVNLANGTASGAGTDTLVDVENVDGSRFKDVIQGNELGNRLDGRFGPDEIYGHGGRDFIFGRGGDDLLFGQRGNDVLRGGPGKDQLDGGDGNDVCKGGADPDSYVFCENFPIVRLTAGVWFREVA
jgi:Ca2+-binding RTX toxin-like protein